MNLKKLESEVMINSIKLNDVLPGYMKEHKGKHVAFNDGEAHFCDTLDECVAIGIKKFGEDVGFAVKKVSMEITILSSLVTL
ncbi:MAG: hypothetical protein QM472_02775 [Spirochaetota bacterium]|nr:hypothetical protein [Spirochaetota bacterium]OPZ39796.1 MAG: hypothetical protein BWY96_00119 [Spirochaetes bacterium ADurb.BinA120]HPV96735.1 hypothetical protein [Spirochaetota bacterium]